ncbi:unnamed protein product [Mytilus edulis]|uniref:CARD domain-containing protein n=1 Tax=Mytilus edulis TaxID=6550 RepID=A0A8S3RHM7_MYTED|nr:unnamed protein product [Mytilus edulis]
MSTNQPQNLSEWQLYCVLKRTNLLQYYDRFIRQGGNEHLPSYIKKADDTSLSPAEASLKSNVATDDYSEESEKKRLQPQQKDKLKPPRLVKDQKQHELFPYYDELINQTVLDKMVLDNLISRCILMIEDREEIIKPTTQHVNDNAIRIQKNYTLLVNNIVSTTDVTDYLIGEDIMQHEEREEVCASGLTTNESNRRLLDKLLYKDRNGYHQLLKALRHAEYLQIANEVSNTAVTELDQKLYRIGITQFRDRQDSKEDKFEDFQFIRSTIEKLASTQDDVIPKNILERLLKDWDTGYVCNVSNNRNMNSTMFLERFINNLNNFDHSKQEKLACTQDINNADIALSGSCSMGTVDLVKWLISRKSDINYCGEGADVNKRRSKSTTPLLIACYKNRIKVVRVLLRCDDVDIELSDKNGCSPIHIASQQGHVDVVQELLQYSANVNACNFEGVTPLKVAQDLGHLEVAALLIAESAN